MNKENKFKVGEKVRIGTGIFIVNKATVNESGYWYYDVTAIDTPRQHHFVPEDFLEEIEYAPDCISTSDELMTTKEEWVEFDTTPTDTTDMFHNIKLNLEGTIFGTECTPIDITDMEREELEKDFREVLNELKEVRLLYDASLDRIIKLYKEINELRESTLKLQRELARQQAISNNYANLIKLLQGADLDD